LNLDRRARRRDLKQGLHECPPDRAYRQKPIYPQATFYVAVHYTHKIYGPLVSINRFVDELVEGKTPSRLALRDGDELQDLASKLNILAEKYKNHQ
jgi:hypothetical protein